MGMSEVRRGSASGFTLVELMIVIVIVAVLMGVALPAFKVQMMKGHRTAAKGEMLDIAARQQQFLLANRAYTADFGDIGYTLPPAVGERYTAAITVDNSGFPTFTITFTAIGAQVDDGGPLTLTSQGAKSPADLWK